MDPSTGTQISFWTLSIIAAAYWLAPTMGVYGLVVGIVGGSLAHLLVQLPVLVRKGAQYTPSLTLRDPGVRTVAKLMGPRTLTESDAVDTAADRR